MIKTLNLKVSLQKQLKTAVSSIVPVTPAGSTTGSTKSVPATTMSPGATPSVKIVPGVATPAPATPSPPPTGASSSNSTVTSTKPGTGAATTAVAPTIASMTTSLAGVGAIKVVPTTAPQQKIPILPKSVNPGGSVTTPSPTTTDDVSVKQIYKTSASLTGISDVSPTLISLSDFKPLYDLQGRGVSWSAADDDDFAAAQTPVGLLLDVLHQKRSLRGQTIASSINKVIGANSSVASSILSLVEANKTSIDELRSFLNFSSDVLTKISQAKRNLDLRAQIYKYDPEIQDNSESFSKILNISSCKGVDLTSTLAAYGYNEANIRNSWSSTKIWLQLVREWKLALHSHTPRLLKMNTSARYADKNTFKVYADPSQHLYFSATALSTTLGYTELVDGMESQDASLGGPASLNEENFNSAIQKISNIFQTSYNGAAPKNENDYIAASIHLLVSEIRWSTLLKNPSFLKTLNGTFSYTPATPSDNFGFLDALCGVPQNSIFDIYPGTARSLTSYAQLLDGEEAILKFENSYIKNADSIYTPGSEYYFDKIFKQESTIQNFDTTRLSSASRNSDAIRKWVLGFINDAGLSSSGNTEESGDDGPHPVTTFDELSKLWINTTTYYNSQFATTDPVAALYAASSGSLKLRAMLFLAMIYRSAYISFPSTALTAISNLQIIAGRIIDEFTDIANSLGVAISQQSAIATLKRDTIYNALVEGTGWYDSFCKKFVKDYIDGPSKLVYTKTVSSAINIQPNVITTNTVNIDTGKLVNSGMSVMTLAGIMFDTFCRLASQFSGIKLLATTNNAGDGRQYIIERHYTSHKEAYTMIRSALLQEEELVLHSALQIINASTRIRNSFYNIDATLKTPDAVAAYDYAAKMFTDPAEFSLLFSESQLMTTSSIVDDATDVMNDSRATSLYSQISSSEIAANTVGLLKAGFSTPEYSTSAALNKRIITVGLPSGFLASLQSVINASVATQGKNTLDRQRDIVRINIHRIDERNPLVVLKPRSYLFELSRFPVRNAAKYPKSWKKPSKILDLASSIQTRDYSAGRIVESLQDAFSDQSYSFLSSAEKDQLRHNHSVHFLSEIYLKILSGLDLSEAAFLYNPATTLKNQADPKVIVDVHNTLTSLVTAALSSTAGSNSSAMFSSLVPQAIPNIGSQTGGSSGKPGAPSITSQTAVTAATDSFSMLSGITSMPSTLSDPVTLAQRLGSPKKFDRVFHIIVDSSDFEVDTATTKSTKSGVSTLNNSYNVGTIQSPAVQSTSIKGASILPPTKLITNDEDVVIEQYFVSVETYDGDIL